MIPLLDGYELATPASLADVLADLSADPPARPFAGGTDLMVVLEAGHLPPGRYVSLRHCHELSGIDVTVAGVSIGALTTYSAMLHSASLSQYPMLKQAASETGGRATQNRGTIGGNIANGSPAADTPPALLVYDAELELMSSRGTRRVPYAAFHLAYKKMAIEPGELIARVHLPARGEGWRDYYRKVGTRRAQAISKVCFAGSIALDGNTVKDVRIAVGSVAPTVVRAVRTEASLRGRRLDPAVITAAAQALAAEISPIDDVRSTARYRAAVAGNLLREFLQG